MKRLFSILCCLLAFPAFGGTLLTDTFTDTEGTSVAIHVGENTAWTLAPALGTGTTEISSNRARAISGTSVWRSSAVPASANYDIYMTVRFVSNTGTMGVYGRCTHNGATGYLGFYSTAGGAWALQKYVAGTPTVLDSDLATLSAGTDYPIKLEMVGTAIKLYVHDGMSYVERCSATDSSITAAGAPAIYLSGTQTDTTGLHAADVSVEHSGAAPVYSNHVGFVADGDSITGDFARLGTITLSQALAAPSRWNTFRWKNYSVAGQTVASMNTDAATQIDPLYVTTAGCSQRVAMMIGSPNDLGSDAATVEQRIRDWHTGRLAAGYKTIGGTILPATTVTGTPETVRTTVNAALLANPPSTWFIDTANIPNLTDPTNTTYYVDGVHPTVTGINLVADEVFRVVKPLPAKQSMFFSEFFWDDPDNSPERVDHYAVWLARNGGVFQEIGVPLVRHLPIPPQLLPGRYEFSVTAVDELERHSEPSEWAPFRALAVQSSNDLVKWETREIRYDTDERRKFYRVNPGRN